MKGQFIKRIGELDVVEEEKKEIIRLLDDIQDRRFIKFVLALLTNHNK